MEKEKKKYFAIAGLIAFGIVLYAILMNLTDFLNSFTVIAGYFLPLFAGLIIAFVLNVPSHAFAKLLRRIFPKAKSDKRLNSAGVILTLMSLAAIFIIMSQIVLPVLSSSISSAYDRVLEKLPEWKTLIEEYSDKNPFVSKYLSKIGSNLVPASLSEGTGSIFKTMMGAASDTISGLVAFAMGLIISIYILFDKETVLRHTGKIVTATFSSSTAAKIRRVAGMLSDTYSKFLSGQCVEALVLGVLLFLSLTVFGMPYAALTAMLTAVFSFVPYIGAFASAATGAFLTYITMPEKFILFIIIFLVIQIIEEQFIYPHIVGNSVGLSPLLTLLSVILGGTLMGLFGMLFFIPLMSVAYMLVYEWVNRRIAGKKTSS